MVNEIVRELELALELVQPTLMLSIDAGSTEVYAQVFPNVLDLDTFSTFDLSTTVARIYLGKCSHFILAGDLCDIDEFNAALDEVDAGRLLVDPYAPPTCTLASAVEFINDYLITFEYIDLDIGKAKWRVTR